MFKRTMYLEGGASDGCCCGDVDEDGRCIGDNQLERQHNGKLVVDVRDFDELEASR